MQKDAEKRFDKAANWVSKLVGSSSWLMFSILMVLIWAPSGFIIGFNDTWQLIINTSTTILTFLMMSLLHASESKWEKHMETMELKQEKILRLLEQKTEKLIKDIETDHITRLG
jgi:low affinity Fe/Cu permease